MEEIRMNAVALTDEELTDVEGGAYGSRPKEKAGKGLKWYHVTATDTLIGIARRFHTTANYLFRINSDTITDKNRIGQHMWIRVPNR